MLDIRICCFETYNDYPHFRHLRVFCLVLSACIINLSGTSPAVCFPKILLFYHFYGYSYFMINAHTVKFDL